ncbi:MAG TPA: serine hydrolase domain-containing protein [Vicinamibacteria bacterium]|jgi:CubicO group peptidase (beta-lactamase class C family)|nr:serine hydrolase domain-containing protein [Vicinamibacteria bacterium]
MGIVDKPCGRRQFLSSSLRTSMAATLVGSGVRALAPRVASSTSPEDDADRYVAGQMEKYGIPGMSVAVVKQGTVVKNRGYGRASLEFDLPADGESVYQIASVTKIFAGLATMLLVEDRKLNLHTPVTAFFPESSPAWRQIRVHHLLEHTSGLPPPSANLRMRQEKEKRRDHFVDADQLDTFTAAEIMAFASELPLEFEPGTKWAYNQTGYLIVGAIVKALSGKPFHAFLDERVFAALGMGATHFGDSRVLVPRRPATAYSRQSGRLRNWIWPYSTTDYPAAGLNTSTADLSRLFLALHAGLLSKSSCERMWTSATLAEGKTAPYGLGWTIQDLAGHKAVGHEGGGCCWVTHLPSEGLTAIALSNLAGARADETANDLVRLYL